jgi:hypothetical protein
MKCNDIRECLSEFKPRFLKVAFLLRYRNYILTPGANVIKLFAAVSYEFLH